MIWDPSSFPFTNTSSLFTLNYFCVMSLSDQLLLLLSLSQCYMQISLIVLCANNYIIINTYCFTSNRYNFEQSTNKQCEICHIDAKIIEEMITLKSTGIISEKQQHLLRFAQETKLKMRHSRKLSRSNRPPVRPTARKL